MAKLADATDKIGLQFVRIWPQMVAITFVQSLFWLIVSPILTAGSIYLAYKLNPYTKMRSEKAHQERKFEQEQFWILARVSCWVVAVIITIAAFLNLPGNLTGT